MKTRGALKARGAPSHLRESEIDGPAPKGLIDCCFAQRRNGKGDSNEARGIPWGPLIQEFQGSSGNVVVDEERVAGVKGVEIGFTRVGMSGDGLPVVEFEVVLGNETGNRGGPEVSQRVTKSPVNAGGN